MGKIIGTENSASLPVICRQLLVPFIDAIKVSFAPVSFIGVMLWCHSYRYVSLVMNRMVNRYHMNYYAVNIQT